MGSGLVVLTLVLAISAVVGAAMPGFAARSPECDEGGPNSSEECPILCKDEYGNYKVCDKPRPG